MSHAFTEAADQLRTVFVIDSAQHAKQMVSMAALSTKQ